MSSSYYDVDKVSIFHSCRKILLGKGAVAHMGAEALCSCSNCFEVLEAITDPLR